MNQPGSLTPIGYSPLPYATNQRSNSFPMVSMSESPKQTPSIDEINSLAQEIANLFSNPTNNYGGLTPIGLPSLPSINNYGLPSLPSINNYSSVRLPLVKFPALSPVQLPSVNSVKLPYSFPQFKSNLLSDNEIGDLRWNRPNPPVPLKMTSSYRRIGCIGDGSCFFHAISKGLSDNYQLSYKPFNTITEGSLRQFESSINNVMTFPPTLLTNPQYYNFNNLMNQYRREYAKMLRQDFANQVLNDQKMQAIIRKRLSGSIELQLQSITVNQPNLPFEQAQTQAFQIVLRELAQELLSGNAVQPDFMTLLSDQVDVDIYLIQNEHLINADYPDTTTVLYGRSLHDTVHGPSDLRDKNDIYAREPNRTAIVIIAIDDIHYEIVARVDENGGIQTKMTEEEPLIRRLYEILKSVRYIV